MTSSETIDSNEWQLSKTRHKTNFAILCITFVLVYTSFNAVTNLQSSIHSHKNVGYYSLAIISGCTVFSCLFITNPLIFLCGYKWTIVLAQFAFLLYIAANVYPKIWIIYPASVICGLFKAGFWTALSAYISDLSIVGENGHVQDAVVNKYFAIFFSTFQTAQIWGNLVTYIILRTSHYNSNNSTIMIDNTNQSQCGAYFVENEQKEMNVTTTISNSTAYILYGVFMGLILISIVLVIIMLDQKRKCLIMIVYGIAASIFSVIVGWLGRYNTRVPCYILAAVLCYSSYIVMLLWKPSTSQTYVLFIIVIMQGIATAIWDPVESALYAILFVKKEEAAYSNLWLGQNAGYFIVYFYGPTLRVQTTIILQLVYLTLALVGYFLVEIHLYRKRRQNILNNNYIETSAKF
ncbi:hypothetical protein I4U23_003482 [Adineta vaga]|nr:hypothetical protein I4U23_003482 [Adineta vaga]